MLGHAFAFVVTSGKFYLNGPEKEAESNGPPHGVNQETSNFIQVS